MRCNRIAGLLARGVLAGCVFGPVAGAWAADAPPTDTAAVNPNAPVYAQFRELQTQYSERQRAASLAYAQAQGKPDAERIKIYEDAAGSPLPFAQKAMALAKQEPQGPAALEALTFVLQLTRGNEPEGVALRNEAIEQLSRDHLNDPKIERAFIFVLYPPSEAGEKLLQAAAEKSTNREVRGTALLYEGQSVRARAERTGDPAQLARARQLFQQLVDQYADVHVGRHTLGEAGSGYLFEMENLAIGKTAPEIEGKNQDDKPMKLSDYRGKVVVLDFWGDW